MSNSGVVPSSAKMRGRTPSISKLDIQEMGLCLQEAGLSSAFARKDRATRPYFIHLLEDVIVLQNCANKLEAWDGRV